jgi:hypothetical protein
VVTVEELMERDLMWTRFNRLATELIAGKLARNTFQQWEIDVLLDAAGCSLEPRRRVEILQKYQHAVNRQLNDGPGPPMKLSDYLQQNNTRRP